MYIRKRRIDKIAKSTSKGNKGGGVSGGFYERSSDQDKRDARRRSKKLSKETGNMSEFYAREGVTEAGILKSCHYCGAKNARASAIIRGSHIQCARCARDLYGLDEPDHYVNEI